MSTSRKPMKGGRQTPPVGDYNESDSIHERPLDIPFSFGSRPTIINSQFSVPEYQGEGSIDPDTLKRPKDTFISFGNRAAIHNSNFTTNLPPTGTSETTQYTPAGELHPDSRGQRPNNTFIQFDKSASVHDSTFSQFGANSQLFMFPSSAQALSNPIQGFHAWNESEKISALTALHSLQTVIQIVIKDRGSDEEEEEEEEQSLHASLSSYMEFVNYLVESRLPERTGSLQARAIYLVVLAGVAIFLGVVQLLTLALVAWLGTMATGRSNSNTVGKVINIFAFCGVSFDALGAMFALWTFRSLILTIFKIEKIVFEKQNLNAKIHFTLDTFREAASSPPPRRRTKGKGRVSRGIPSENLVNLFADFQQSSAKHHREAREVVHLIDDHLSVQEDCITLAIIAAGLLFFFVSLFSFIISTQPFSVWASTTVLVAVTFIILRIILGHQQPGFWRSIIWRVRTTITECFPLRNMGADRIRRGESDRTVVEDV